MRQCRQISLQPVKIYKRDTEKTFFLSQWCDVVVCWLHWLHSSICPVYWTELNDSSSRSDFQRTKLFSVSNIPRLSTLIPGQSLGVEVFLTKLQKMMAFSRNTSIKGLLKADSIGTIACWIVTEEISRPSNILKTNKVRGATIMSFCLCSGRRFWFVNSLNWHSISRIGEFCLWTATTVCSQKWVRLFEGHQVQLSMVYPES